MRLNAAVTFFFFFFFFAFHFSGKNFVPPPPLFGAELRHCIYTFQKKLRIILTDFIQCVYMLTMCRIVINLKSKHFRNFIVNSLLIPFIGSFYSTRFKLKLFEKQFALNSE